MKFLIDVCVSSKVACVFGRDGHAVTTVGERDRRMCDEDILRWAHAEGYVLVTNDKDFGRYLWLHHAPHNGIIRLPSAPGIVQAALVEQIMAHHIDALREGALITATEDRIRVRHGHLGSRDS